jgi:hypothetical protein
MYDKRERGRQPEKILDNLRESHGTRSTTDLITSTKDNELRWSMTNSICRQDNGLVETVRTFILKG